MWVWVGKYSETLNLVYFIIISKMQGQVIQDHLKIVHIWHKNTHVI
jgi:hypothetical protein